MGPAFIKALLIGGITKYFALAAHSLTVKLNVVSIHL